MSDENRGMALGKRLRELRRRNGWTLAMVSEKTGLAQSTLSKVERNKMLLAYDNLIRLADGLGLDIAELFTEAAPVGLGRRSITRSGEGLLHRTPNYEYEMLGTELSSKQMVPLVVRIKSRSIEEFGGLMHHAGEEVTYVIDGRIEAHTEHYEPTILEPGDSIYLDSTMGHAYISVGAGDATVLGVCSHLRSELAAAAKVGMKKNSRNSGKTKRPGSSRSTSSSRRS